MATTAKNEGPHDLNCLSIKELEHLAEPRMDKQTRDCGLKGRKYNWHRLNLGL